MTLLTVNDALNDYYIKKLSRRSDNTVRHNECELERWRLWLVQQYGPNIKLSEVDDMTQALYFNRLKTRVQPATFNNYRQYQMSFWQYCVGESWLRVNPMRHVDPLPVPRKIRRQLSAGEMKRLLDGASPRDRVALAIGANTALRAQDIAALVVGAVNFEDNTLLAYIHKTKKEKLFKMGPDLRQELFDWMHEYARAMDIAFEELPNDWTLVPPGYGAPLVGGGYEMRLKPTKRYRHIEEIVNRALVRIDIPIRDADGVSLREGFHTLRRSLGRITYNVATANGDRGAIRKAQALLGHQSQAHTEVYLGVSQDEEELNELMESGSILDAAIELDRANVARVEATREERRLRSA